MNIFIFHPNFHISARWFFENDFKRANKQILESTEMIAVATLKLGLTRPIKDDGQPYKASRHQNHPCTKYTYESRANFQNHVNYVWALCRVYNKLTGKSHACQRALQRANILPTGSTDIGNVPFVGLQEYRRGLLTVSPKYDIYYNYVAYIFNKWKFQDGKII